MLEQLSLPSEQVVGTLHRKPMAIETVRELRR